MYKFVFIIENNKIGDEGCLHMSRTQWPKLSTVNLGNLYRTFRLESNWGLRMPTSDESSMECTAVVSIK